MFFSFLVPFSLKFILIQKFFVEKPAGKQFMDGLVRDVVLVTDPLKKKMLQGKVILI